MPELVLPLLGLLASLGALTCLILGMVAFFRLAPMQRTLELLQSRLASLESRLGALERPPPEVEKPVSEAAPPPKPAAPPPVPPPVLPVAPAVEAPPPAGPPVQAPPAGAPAPARESIESRIGKRWMTWVGAVALFFSAAFFLKYAFDNEWIGPTGQVTLCALAGAAMVGLGSWCIRKRWPFLGRGLMGLGLAVLYATFYAASSDLYEPTKVMSESTAFGCMVAVTVAGMTLAVLHNALSMAFLTVLGGLLTPVLVSTGVDARDALFAYLLLLDVGVLAVALFRNWRLLDALALAGTVLLYAGWYGQFGYRYVDARLTGPLAAALAWLGAFYVVFLALPFVHHLIRRIRLPIERFVMALVNAAFAGTFAWLMLYEDRQFALGFVALGMAAVYVTLGWVVRRRLPDDPRSLFGTIALSVTLLTLAVPLHLRAEGILLAWVAEAPVLLYLGYRFRYRPVRAFAAVVLGVGIVRLFWEHWPEHEELYRPFVNTKFITAVMVPAAMAVFALIHQRCRSLADQADRMLKLCSALGAGVLLLILAHPELAGWLKNELGPYYAACGVVALWAVGSLGHLFGAARARSAPTFWTGAAVLLVALILAAATFGQSLSGAHRLALNLRFAVCLLAVLVAFLYAWAVRRAPVGLGDDQRQGAAMAVYSVGAVALLGLLSTEVYTFCIDFVTDVTRARRAGQMAITLVWGLYAVCLLMGGFWRRLRPLRLAGLGLFGVAALKLVLVDMTHVRELSRIISFLALGLLMVAASYLYHKLEKRLVPAAPAGQEAEGGAQ